MPMTAAVRRPVLLKPSAAAIEGRMDDERIVGLYFERDEDAIAQTSKKYGKYCYSIAMGILRSHEDSEECVNSVYVDTWNTIPPQRPNSLSAFLGKLTRRISIKRLRSMAAQKRGGGEYALALEELDECVPDRVRVEDQADAHILAAHISDFLCGLPDTERRVFVQRYFYMRSVSELARNFGFTQSKVKSMLYRTRQKLREALVKEGDIDKQ